MNGQTVESGGVTGRFAMKILQKIAGVFVGTLALSGWLIGLVMVSMALFPQLGLYIEHLGG